MLWHQSFNFVILIKSVGLFIKEYNEGENALLAQRHLKELGLDCFFGLEELKRRLSAENSGLTAVMETYAFTDDRELADSLKECGVGFAVYYNRLSRTASFNDALYMVDSICSLSLQRIDRFLLRYLRLPWKICETERCIVREITEEDVDRLYEIYSEPGYVRYTDALYDDPEKERAYTREYINTQYRFFEFGIWVVEEKASGKVIGRAGITTREGFEELELGYGFSEEYQGKGYAYEVCSAILDYARNSLLAESINSFTMKENIPSIRLLEKLGFIPAGEIMIDGKPYERYNVSYEKVQAACGAEASIR